MMIGRKRGESVSLENPESPESPGSTNLLSPPLQDSEHGRKGETRDCETRQRTEMRVVSARSSLRQTLDSAHIAGEMNILPLQILQVINQC